MAEESADATQERKRGTRAGLAAIAFGLVTAVILYFIERRSTYFIRQEHATGFAFMYAALWAVLGLLVIRWYNRLAPDHAATRGEGPDAIAAAKEKTWQRRKGTMVGLLVIALGLASAIVMYLVDSASFDFFAKMHAMEFAFLHAFLWGIVGVVMILWHNRQPPDHSNTRLYDPNDPLR